MKTFVWNLRTAGNGSGVVWDSAETVDQARVGILRKMSSILTADDNVSTETKRQIFLCPVKEKRVDEFDVISIGSFSFDPSWFDYDGDFMVEVERSLSENPIETHDCDKGSGFCSSLDG